MRKNILTAVLYLSLFGCVPLYPIITLVYSVDAAHPNKQDSSLSNLLWAPDGNSIFFVRIWTPYKTTLRKASYGPSEILIPEGWFTPIVTETGFDPSRPKVYEIIEITFKERRKSIIATSHVLKKWDSMENQWTIELDDQELEASYGNGGFQLAGKRSSENSIYSEVSQEGFMGAPEGLDQYVIRDPQGAVKYVIPTSQSGVPQRFSLSPDKQKIALINGENIYMLRVKDLPQTYKKNIDPIEILVSQLSADPLWDKEDSLILDMPQDAAPGPIAVKAYETLFPGQEKLQWNQMRDVRTVRINGRLPGSYGAVLLYTKHGTQVVLIQYVPGAGWWTRVYTVDIQAEGKK